MPLPDIIFACPSCTRSISAGEELLGQMVECPYCQTQFAVDVNPQPEAVSSQANDAETQGIQAKIDSLEGQLRENITQTTEHKGNMNRLNMELHRHQLRLTKLIETQDELTEKIRVARSRLSGN